MKIKRWIGALLCMLLCVGMLPTMAFASGEDSGKAIQLGTGEISGYSGTDGYDYIYFGEFDSRAVKWRVLSNKGNGGTYTYNTNKAYSGTALFMLTDEVVEYAIFNDSSNNEGSNEWQGSLAQGWCADFYSNNLTQQEQGAVLATSKSDGSNYYYAAAENILAGDHLFFLSAEEADTDDYGFIDDDSRIASRYVNEEITVNGEQWWLRSRPMHAFQKESAGAVNMGGSRSDSKYWNPSVCTRPAFNLKADEVLFISSAAGGKATSVANNELSAVAENTGSEWKLTLLDSSRSSFKANVNGQTSAFASAGGSVQITHSGAQTGDNEYVSVLLCDNDDNVLYYGNIAQNSTSGTAALNIPSGLDVGSYSLKVFSEQCNGDYKTDYAGAFQEISLNVLPKEATPQAVFTATGDNGGTLSNVESCMKYSTDGGASRTDVTGATMELTGVTVANDVKVYKPGNGTTTGDSAVQTIDITQADKPTVSGADCTTSEQNDGKIIGVNSTMEYRLSAASEWTGITDTEVTGLSNGTYDVRVKANGTVLASAAATVTIGAHTCVAQGEWQYDANEHWKLCACGAEVGRTAHSGGTATCKDSAVCAVCGQSYGEKNMNNHTDTVVWVQTATTHKQVYSCCQTEASKEEKHNWADGKCTVCDYSCTHNGGTATCSQLAVCDTCGEEYGEVNASNHTNLVKTEAKPATHMTEGNIEYWYCDGCEKYFSDEAGTKEIVLADTVVPKLTGHTADGTGWHSDETNHWNTCECGEKLNEAAHTFEWVIDKEETATEKGSKHEKCTVCGYEKAAVEIPATGTPSDTHTPSGNQTGDSISPQTGDDSNIALWIALLLAAGAALTGTAVYRRKRKYNR